LCNFLHSEYKKVSPHHQKTNTPARGTQYRGKNPLKALLVTGTLAQNTVLQYAKQSKTHSEILTLKIPVAALLTPQLIIQALKKTPPTGIDVVLTPGQMRGDTSEITAATGIPAFKGPRYAADLPVVLDALGEVALSTIAPACDLMAEKVKAKALEELEKVEADREALLKKPGSLLIGDLAVGKEFPMRVLSEIVDAPLLETCEIQRLAKHYVATGADIVDLGMLAWQCRPDDVKRAVAAVKAVVNVPVSIDTLKPQEIQAAVEAGVDLILSGDDGNLEKIAPYAKDTAVVIIPTNQRRGYFPQEVGTRVSMLERLVKKAKRLGFKRIVGDLVLEPSNVLDSYVAYRDFARRNPNVPLMVGIANVVELFDADSVGLNALLARLSSEVDASILLVTEKSPKAKGSIKEASVAAKMMYLAKKRNSVPRDLGLDLLILKEKTERESSDILEADCDFISAQPATEQFVADPCGVFRVAVDHQGGDIVVLHYVSVEAGEPLHVLRGRGAEALLAEVVRLGLVSRLEHSAYLGRELAKAELALQLGRGYVQDAELFG
jgi:dihydropteroate synthase-like protein